MVGEEEKRNMKIKGILIHDYYTGLCNQLIQLLHGIMFCIGEGVDVVVVGDFKTDLDSEICCPVEDVLDMDHLFHYFYKHYGIVVVGLRQLDLDVRTVVYGTMSRFVDLTEPFRKECFSRDPLRLIVRGDQLNHWKGDPAPGRRKSLRVLFQIKNKCLLWKNYAEEHLALHIQGIVFERHPDWPRQLRWMDNLARIFSFHPSFYQYSLFGLSTTTLVHVAHVRLEPDAICHWSKENNMSQDAFRDLLVGKYIGAIQRHMSDGVVLVLSYDHNPVVQWLEEKNRAFFFVGKEKKKGREWSAIEDMCLAEKYGNGVFLGNFDSYRMQGSTFSYFLMKRCRFQKSVLIDIERIHEDECLFPGAG